MMSVDNPIMAFQISFLKKLFTFSPYLHFIETILED